MSYQVLARKWRPQNFSQMVGQEHVLRALVNALEQQRLHHAYLFTGTRGVGKTTIARILAKSLNCAQKITANPCGECENCRQISDGRFVDLIEVDGASKTKVEDTREMLDNVQYAPSVGRYKVYLIDEVHMLSVSSFNALLKTLEEPPQHVVFLLATTDLQKIPATVLSRCLQFHLKTIAPDTIASYLAQLLQTESIKFEPVALNIIGNVAHGSMRDALSLLDQAISFGNGKVNADLVQQMLGLVDKSLALKLLGAIFEHKALDALELIAALFEQALNPNSLLDELLRTLHQIALYQQYPQALSEQQAIIVKPLANLVSAERLQVLLQILLICKRDLPLVPEAKIALEMMVLRMLAFEPAPELKSEPKQESMPKLAAKAAAEPETSLAVPNAPAHALEPNRAQFSENFNNNDKVLNKTTVPASTSDAQCQATSQATAAATNTAADKPLPEENLPEENFPEENFPEENFVDESSLSSIDLAHQLLPKTQQNRAQRQQRTKADGAFNPPPEKPAQSQPHSRTEKSATTADNKNQQKKNNSSAKAQPIATQNNDAADNKPPSVAISFDNDTWLAMVERLGLTGLAFELAKNSSLIKKDNNCLEIAVAGSLGFLKHQQAIDELKTAVNNYANCELKIVETKAATADSQLTLAQHRHRQLEKQQQLLVASIENDAVVKKLQLQFQARIDYNSIRKIDSKP